MALSAEALVRRHWRSGYLSRRDQDPVQILTLDVLRRLNLLVPGPWSAPAIALESDGLSGMLHPLQGQPLAGHVSQSSGERLERSEQPAPGCRRSER